MIACAETSLDDFYVIVHEMGHLQYYMAFADQPTIYQVPNFYNLASFSIVHNTII